ncbi:FG-GAP repeat protein [Roseivivax jejudonensis]|uniref:FG-GAP repeat protein n=1 Tax=Roseivivax jejudonensis TaxID=1529041 RepID=A0A1X6ZFN3_9RHOB|nr:VCBS repeat-containing protein [Roseivivax jejudonensis]SLN50402.1 FG-GAP repeat protein [Roseivivax jejudonensis]
MLGDALEWRSLEMTLTDGRRLRATLPADMVFEDLAPRLWDVDGDGAPEVVTVETALDRGARLAIWSAEGRRAATPFIGERHRWLAPLAAADLDGDGRVEIAYVDRPHLARVLRLWRLEGDRLVAVASMQGVTNHRIGEAVIHGGLRACGDRPELVAADGTWRRLLAIGFDGTRLSARDIGPWSPEAEARARACR